MKHCNICASDGVTLKVSPKNHEPKHGEQERACGQCWEAYLSLQVEEKNESSEIECMFCKSEMSESDFQSLAQKGTKVRHAMKIMVDKGYICMHRCDGFKTVQPYDREADGRIFTCEVCKFQVCTDCDRPEHTEETCLEYKSRLAAIHSEAEKKTRKAFKSCPDCKTLVEPEKASCYTQCTCGVQFCSSCLVNWVGVGSAYLAGKEAHGPRCKYLLRDKESKHSLGNRWQQTEEVQGRLEVKAAGRLKRKRSKMEAAEEAAEEATEEEVADETKGGHKAKNAKKTAKTKLKAKWVFLHDRY